MYLCVKGIAVTSSCDLSIGFETVPRIWYVVFSILLSNIIYLLHFLLTVHIYKAIKRLDIAINFYTSDLVNGITLP